ncbi:trypsin-like serine peptidase [Streptomyces alboflavus]|uniref:trypsin-like serine peptidase n=1 Tax=Streptomyces alboflavus TaxID=67267 RepID=UPI0004C1ACE1|nr:trypsin-like serine protease [Streptomyces alboflavus]
MTATSPSLFRRLRGRALGLAVAGAALAVAAPVVVTGAAGQADAAADPASALKFTAAERKDALAYWTPARMKAVGRSVDLGPSGPKAKPWQGPKLKTVGRLFFVNSGGADTWCTATAVKSANRSAVMTAAHCVRRGSSPVNTNIDMVFVPGYHKGKAPHGVFPVRQAITPRAWETDSTDDMATLVVAPDKNGKKLTDVVGARAVAFDRPVGGTVSALGYSATRPQRGESLLRCVGTAKKEHGTQVIPCDMSGGSSGGPWFADFDASTGRGTLISVNSALDSLEPTKMYGEVFGSLAKKVYERAQNA